MRVVTFLSLVPSFLLGASVSSESFPTNVPLNYNLTEGSITLNDVSTEIRDIKSLFNGKTFDVHVELSWMELESFRNTTNVLKWDTYVDGVLSSSGEEQIDQSRELPGSINVGQGTVFKSGAHTIKVEVTLDGDTINVERNYQSFNGGASIIPLIAVLVLAGTTQMVELSLGFGVFVGACMVAGNVVNGFKTTLDTFILGALADTDHGYVYLFALFMSGFVGMIDRSGGLQGFTKFMSKYAKSARTGMLAGFATALMMFFDDYANLLVTGSANRSIFDSLSISRQKLAFIVDGTSAPVASVIPVSSWVGFEVSLIQGEINKIVDIIGEENLTIPQSGFSVFLQTIAYRFYPIFMLFTMASLILSQRDYGPMLISERLVRVYGRTDGGPGATMSSSDENSKEKKNDNPEKPWNMIVPILLLVFYILYLLVMTGYDGTGTQSFLDIMANSDSYSALLWGTMGAALTSLLMYMLQFKKDGVLVKPTLASFIPGFIAKRIKKFDTDDDKYPPQPLMTPREGMDSFLHGMEHIFPALVVLTLAWASGSVMTAIGLDRLFSQLIVDGGIAPGMLPTISFVASVFIAFATGSSWGTMTIMFPLLVMPAYMSSNGDPNIVYGVTAGILSGAVAGDHVSPISDTTVLSAISAQCGLLEHVKTQAPYAGQVILWSILVGTIPTGMGSYPTWAAILLGLVAVLIVTFSLGVKVINPTGRYDPITELYLKIKPNEELLELKKDVITAYETGQFVPLKKKEKQIDDDVEKAEVEQPLKAPGSEPIKEVEMVGA